MRVIAINGSHKTDGNCAYLINTIFKDLSEKGVETKMYSAIEVISDCKWPFCVSCSSPCSKECFGSKLTELFEDMKSSDAVIFASPVYFGSMSGQLKCVFDKTRSVRAEKALLGKPGIAISCGASKYGGQEKCVNAIHDCMLVNGMTVLGPSSSELMGHMGVCASAPSSEDEFAVSRAHAAALRIYEELTK